MVTVVPMPKLGAGVFEEGKIVKWLKKEGEYVKEGEKFVEIETQKATVLYESPYSGHLLKYSAAEGESVAIGEPICVLGRIDEQVTAPEKTAAASNANNQRLEDTAGKESPQFMIAELSTIRAAIAKKLTASQRESAQVTLTREAEVSRLVDFFTASGKRLGLSYTDVFVKAVAKALVLHPMLNSSFETDRIKVFKEVNIGIAVAIEGGLITPVIRNANSLSLVEISKKLGELSEKARKRELSVEEVTNGTFTISNLGMFGIDGFTPIINPPQAAILGIGRIIDRAWVEKGIISVRPTMYTSLTFDHRVVDGADAARFLDEVVKILAQPESLLN